MKSIFEIFLAETRRSWLLFKRYPLQTIVGTFMTTLLFLALVFGARYVAGPMSQFGTRLDEIIVGYVLWNILVFAMGEISIGLKGESQMGTLEQLFLSSLGAPWILLIRALANQALIFFLNIGVLGVILAATGNRLSFPPSLLLPLATVLLGVYGLGFILGSLSLMFKRIDSLMGLSQFGLMALVIVPFENWQAPAVNALPLVPGAIMLRDLMARGIGLDLTLLAWSVLNGFAYFLVGLLVFRWFEARTKERGLLGSY